MQLPLAASLQRTSAVNDKLDAILKATPGVKYYTGVAGFSLLSSVNTTYSSFYFVTLDGWKERDKKGLTADVIIRGLNQRLAGFPDAIAFVTRLAFDAEAADHHPDITINYNKVTLRLTTHSASALTDRDFSLATDIDAKLGSKLMISPDVSP